MVDKQNSDTLDMFQRFFTGNGKVKNLGTKEMITIPEDRRIHVILFPEGYMQDEYDEAKYVRDCLSRYRSVFAFAPMRFFREYFVIWRFPVRSNEHVNRNGGAFNPGVDRLVGAFGANGRYHSELYCLMNGSHDNKLLFSGNGQLRVYDRLCNFCRELAAFRIYERLGVLENDQTSWADWIAEYRAPFYEEFPFFTPEKVPQENSDRQSQWFPCEY